MEPRRVYLVPPRPEPSAAQRFWRHLATPERLADFVATAVRTAIVVAITVAVTKRSSAER